jgi:hypothetical protein
MLGMAEERRAEARMLCADMMEVRWKDRSGKQHKAMALLEDISSSGACLQLETAVPLGSEIGWEAPGQFFSGYVRYCVYREIGYFAGVEFGKSTKWSSKAYRPRHLLDLEKLVVRKEGRKQTPPGQLQTDSC